MRLHSVLVGVLLATVLLVVSSAQSRHSQNNLQVPTEIWLGSDAFADERVQQAFLYTVPWNVLIAEGCPGQNVPVTVKYHDSQQEDFVLVIEDARTWEFDSEQAKALLAQAGYTDGITTDVYLVSEDTDYLTMAQIFQSYLYDGGFDTMLVIAEQGEAPVLFLADSDAGEEPILLGNLCENSSPFAYSTFLPVIGK
jgi:ABC-type transport system substrate-binding protein